MTDLICSHWTTAGVAPAAGGPSRWPIEHRIRACAEAGYRGYGLQLNDYRAIRAAGMTDADLKAILRHHGMRHIEVEFLQNWYADGEAGEASREDEKTLFHMVESFSARVMMMTGELEPTVTRSLEQLIEKFAALCTRAARHGVTIGVEACAFSNIGTPADVVHLITSAGAENAGLYVDVWHLYRRGLDYGWLRDFDRKLIAGVQLGDALPEVQGTLREDSSNCRLLPGDGAAGIVEFVRSLFANGFDGPIAIEILSEAQRQLPLKDAADASYRAAQAVICEAVGTPPLRSSE